MCEVAEKIYEQGEMENAKKMAISLHESGVSEDLIAKAANVSLELIRRDHPENCVNLHRGVK